MAGGVAGLFIGFPLPPIGPVVGALLLASLGAFLGALVGEQWKGRKLDESFRIGQAAFWGRLFGTLGKALMGALMIALIVVALCV
jgi:uncharacterized protein YqgC (DUF456 family)